VNLLTVADAGEILPPSRLLRVAGEVGAGDVMVVADLAPPQTGEIRLSTIGAGPIPLTYAESSRAVCSGEVRPTSPLAGQSQRYWVQAPSTL
jgi:hypothetical protein